MNKRSKLLCYLGCDVGTENVGLSLLERRGSMWSNVETLRLSAKNGYRWLAKFAWDGIDLVHCTYEDTSWVFAKRLDDKGKYLHHGHGSANILKFCGAVELLACQRGATVCSIQPRVWRKRVAGSAKATKEQARCVVERLVEGMPTGLPLDATDAAAICIAGYYGRKF